MKVYRFVHSIVVSLTLAVPLLGASYAGAQDVERTIVVEDHRFNPETVEVPAETRIKLIIENRDATPEEFESDDLRREKVIPGMSKATVLIGPLPEGEYRFFGEFHEDTAQGNLIAK